MRLLIDGYNLMHAAGRMSRRFGPDGLRRARHRFLCELANVLGPEQANRTTVVFDASSLPRNQAPESSHRGMTVIYAIEDEDADTRIELLIAADSAPRSLTVVSTDRRIRKAALRRRAISMNSDDFLDELETRRHRQSSRSPDLPDDAARLPVTPPDAEDTATWLRIFGELDDDAEVDAAYGPGPPEWTDEDLQRVALEVEAEFRGIVRPLPARFRRP